ncbi:MAG: TonB-dependent receptor, partial [Pseudomonadota bacterium]
MRHTGRLLRLTCVLAISLSTFGVYAQSNTLALDEIVVFATPDDLLTVPGSGLVLDQETLERFDHTDLHQILAGTPGIYVREEDGFGLRPNIGIRGATSDRSQKITIMEDGVLITPAPYSAPAAYYVPNVSRMQNIEVIKGPNAIRNGPHTVGGTINFVTESVPSSRVAAVDVSIGSHGYHKLEGRYGQPTGDGGFMIDALRYGSNGFKDLDNGGDTGFDRNEMNAKWSWTQDHATPQRLTLKVGYADETSNETYLGLTDDDFIRNPNRRYLASQMGLFKSNHLNLHLSYGVQWHDSTRLNAKLYLNTFDREWNKLDGFIAGRSVLNVLQRPLLFVREYELLTGTINSTPGVDNDTLDVTNNDRQFSSTGVQVSVSHSLSLASTSHEINAGIRYHTDEVDREHLQRGYLMTDRVLEWDGINRGAKTNNHQSATALALYIEDEISWSDLTVTLGLRFEDIDGERIDFLRDEQTNSSQDFLSPGVGIHWKFTNNIGLIGGVYKGFSPAAPGSSAEPEESLNL